MAGDPASVVTLTNWIDNAAVSSTGDNKSETLAVTSPATGAVVALVPVSTSSDVDAAVRSARTAFESWSIRTVKDRVQVLIRFHQLVVNTYRDELADLIVLEHGKTKTEALAEIAKGLETVEYAFSIPQLIPGRILEVSRGVVCHDIRKPIGVVVSIVPFNFPFMVPMWTMPLIVATGNTMVVKPSEKVPMTMRRTMEILKEAGMPGGVVNLVHGTSGVVNALIENADTKVVTFVGTSRIAELVSMRARGLHKRVLALGGAKNHLVAFPDRNVAMAASDIVASFTGCSGQRCMAASVLLTIGDQRDLVDAIVAKARAIRPGQFPRDAPSSTTSGSGSVTLMGPVIDTASRDKILRYIHDAEAAGVQVLLDGRSWSTDPKLTGGSGGGTWVGPTVLLHTNRSDPALHDEIFGPVLSILVVKSKEEAIEIENANPYGNAACIYTSDGGVADWFTRRFSSGMIGVNIGVPVPREPFSFGGINQSKYGGDVDITGDGGIELFTERRKVTTKWSPPVEQNWMS